MQETLLMILIFFFFFLFFLKREIFYPVDWQVSEKDVFFTYMSLSQETQEKVENLLPTFPRYFIYREN